MKTKKFNESVAASCRYGDVAEGIWGDWDLVWERSDDDYQGDARFLAYKDGTFTYYEWDYGSCSGCDTWEAACMSDAQVAEEMQRDAVTFDTPEAVREWAYMRKDAQMEAELLRFLADNNIINPSPSFVI